MENNPQPPDGYRLMNNYIERESRVKRNDLVFDLRIKLWRKPTTGRYKTLGCVQNYWYVARKEQENERLLPVQP